MKTQHLFIIAILLLTGGGMQVQAQEVNEWEPGLSGTTATVTTDEYKADRVDARKKMPGALKVSFGPARITSKVYVNEYDYFKDKGGYEVMLNYETFGRSNWGFSADLNYNRTSYKGYVDISLLHLGPGLLYGGVLGEHWRLTVGLGLGMSIYNEKLDKQYTYFTSGESKFGFGMMSRVGVEYMVNDQWGIGMDINSALAFIGNGSGQSLPDGETSGFSHVGFLFGVRKYF